MSGRKKIIGMIVVTLLMAGLSLLAERQEVTQNYSLERNPSGEGDYETEMTLVVEGIGEIPYTVTVPEQKLTPQQEKELIAAAKKELAEEFPGDNESMNVIRGAVRIRDSYQNGQVTAAWSFDDGVVDDDGTIVVADIPKEGQLVQASVELQCGETMEWEEFYFRIYKAAQSEKEALLEDLGQKLAEQQEARGSASIELPEKLGQYHLEWNRKKSYTAVEILFLGIVATVLVPAAERSRRREQEKKRQSRMELEYPDIVSKMALLLGAGMTPLGAWKKIAASYEAKRKKKQVPVCRRMKKCSLPAMKSRVAWENSGRMRHLESAAKWAVIENLRIFWRRTSGKVVVDSSACWRRRQKTALWSANAWQKDTERKQGQKYWHL